MSGERPKRQFRLRRLFLWTAVAALILSIGRTLGGQPVELAVVLALLLLLGVVDILRAVLGPWPACLLWIGVWTTLFAIPWCSLILERAPSDTMGAVVGALLVSAVAGCMLAMLAWLPLEVFLQFLDRIDGSAKRNPGSSGK